MALDLKKRWKDSKELYEDTVGKRKPSKDFLSFITRASSGVEPGVEGFDKALAAYEAADEAKRAALFETLEKAAEAAEKAMAKYLAVLEDRTKKEKFTDSAYARGLNVLSRELEAMIAAVQERVKAVKADEKAMRKAASANSPEEILAIGNKNANKKFALLGQTAIKELAAAIAKVRAKPELAFFNPTLRLPLRDIDNAFSAGNLKQIGREDLTQGGGYPDTAIKALSAHQNLTPADDKELADALALITSHTTTVAAWFKKATQK